MRSLREPMALTIRPMRCRNDQNIAEILSKRRQQNSFQVVHFTSARRFDDGQPPALPKPSGSACEPYRQFIEQGLARGRNAMAIWQDLVSDRGFAACYQTVKRFVLKPRGTQCTSDVRSLEVSAPYFISFLSFMSEGAFAAIACDAPPLIGTMACAYGVLGHIRYGFVGSASAESGNPRSFTAAPTIMMCGPVTTQWLSAVLPVALGSVLLAP